MADDPIVTVLDRLDSEDRLTAEVVVKEAEDPLSPLHSKFEWDNKEAGIQYRLEQARRLLRRYYLIREVPDQGQVRLRKYTNVHSANRYMGTEKALVNHRDEVVAAAQRDMRTYRAKYQLLGSQALLDIATEILKS